jgi:inorganic pyrophosphatase
MGSDLFGSFAESTCAALVVIANTPSLIKNPDVLYYPLVISALGILGCFFSTIYGIYLYKVNKTDQIEHALKLQLTISTVFVLIGLYISAHCGLPNSWEQTDGSRGRWYYGFICTTMGLVSGLIIGYSTDYFTSNAHLPVYELARACE